MSDLAALRIDLQRLLDNTEPLQHAVGQFAKTTALEQVAKDLGSDLAFSGWKSKVRLGAGYDLGTPVVLNLRPAGMWFLAEDGRKRRQRITPKRRRAAKNPPHPKAVRTPFGWRAYSNSGPSRGHRTITTARDRIDDGIVTAASEGLNDLVRKGGF